MSYICPSPLPFSLSPLALNNIVWLQPLNCLPSDCVPLSPSSDSQSEGIQLAWLSFARRHPLSSATPQAPTHNLISSAFLSPVPASLNGAASPRTFQPHQDTFENERGTVHDYTGIMGNHRDCPGQDRTYVHSTLLLGMTVPLFQHIPTVSLKTQPRHCLLCASFCNHCRGQCWILLCPRALSHAVVNARRCSASQRVPPTGMGCDGQTVSSCCP